MEPEEEVEGIEPDVEVIEPEEDVDVIEPEEDVEVTEPEEEVEVIEPEVEVLEPEEEVEVIKPEEQVVIEVIEPEVEVIEPEVEVPQPEEEVKVKPDEGTDETVAEVPQLEDGEETSEPAVKIPITEPGEEIGEDISEPEIPEPDVEDEVSLSLGEPDVEVAETEDESTDGGEVIVHAAEPEAELEATEGALDASVDLKLKEDVSEPPAESIKIIQPMDTVENGHFGEDALQTIEDTETQEARGETAFLHPVEEDDNLPAWPGQRESLEEGEVQPEYVGYEDLSPVGDTDDVEVPEETDTGDLQPDEQLTAPPVTHAAGNDVQAIIAVLTHKKYHTESERA